MDQPPKVPGRRAGEAAAGKPADLAKCQAKFTATVGKIEDKAAAVTLACRYGDNADGTVIDYDTGLQWEKKIPGTCTVRPRPCVTNAACGTGTCEADSSPQFVNRLFTWDEAVAYVNGVIADGAGITGPVASLAGHSDWRLPTIAELNGIVDRTACAASPPCIDPTFGPTAGKVGLFSPFYWSARSTPPIRRARGSWSST